jgi:hypothetical protein
MTQIKWAWDKNLSGVEWSGVVKRSEGTEWRESWNSIFECRGRNPE